MPTLSARAFRSAVFAALALMSKRDASMKSGCNPVVNSFSPAAVAFDLRQGQAASVIRIQRFLRQASPVVETRIATP